MTRAMTTGDIGTGVEQEMRGVDLEGMIGMIADGEGAGLTVIGGETLGDMEGMTETGATDMTEIGGMTGEVDVSIPTGETVVDARSAIIADREQRRRRRNPKQHPRPKVHPANK